MSSSSTQTTMQENKKRKKSKHRPTNFIEDNKTRKVTFDKREKTLRKMARELSELCQIKTCFICFGQDGLSFWPERREDVEAIIKAYKEPTTHTKNVTEYTPSSLLIDLKRKGEEKVNKLEKQDLEKLLNYFDSQIEHIPQEAARQMLNLVDCKLEIANARLRLQATPQNGSSFSLNQQFGPTNIYQQQQVNLPMLNNADVSSMLPSASVYDNNWSYVGSSMTSNSSIGGGFLGWKSSETCIEYPQTIESNDIHSSYNAARNSTHIGGSCQQSNNIESFDYGCTSGIMSYINNDVLLHDCAILGATNNLPGDIGYGNDLQGNSFHGDIANYGSINHYNGLDFTHQQNCRDNGFQSGSIMSDVVYGQKLDQMFK